MPLYTKKKLSRKEKKQHKKLHSSIYLLTRNQKIVPFGHFDINNPHDRRIMLKWGRFLAESPNRRILLTEVERNIVISTVFLGLNHRLFDVGSPLIFETMVFGGQLDGQQWRYSTLKQAKKGHHHVESLVKGAENHEMVR